MRRREGWLREIGELTDQMLWGSFTAIYRRCGRASCHCATGEKHGPVYYLSRNEGGRTRNIFVPEELHEEAERGAAAYRRYRELGQEIAEENLRSLGLVERRRRKRKG